MNIDSWKSATITLIKSTTCEHSFNGCMRGENNDHLEKCNASNELKEETKIVDGPELNICKGLGEGDG